MSEDAWRAARYLKEAAGEVERAYRRNKKFNHKLDLSMKKYGVLGLLVILIGAFIYAGTQDYEDAKLAQAHYCSMVKEGRWPAYKGRELCRREVAAQAELKRLYEQKPVGWFSERGYTADKNTATRWSDCNWQPHYAEPKPAQPEEVPITLDNLKIIEKALLSGDVKLGLSVCNAARFRMVKITTRKTE